MWKTMRVSVKYAKAHLSLLITRALCGEEIIICRGSIPLVSLQPITAPEPKKKLTRRVPGRLRGKISWAPNAFDPLTDEELRNLGFED
jgi:antitoxin (DNA-binding transcriptional repressor) of toxin-antitoxin stability system